MRLQTQETVSDVDHDWFDQFIAENTLELRAEVVRRVNAHCCQSGRPHREVWRLLYARLGIPLPTQDRLGFIESEGLMGDLLKIASAL